MALSVQPLHDQIIVEIEPETLGGGIIRPFTMNPVGGPAYAYVRAIGPGRPSDWNTAVIPMPPVVVGQKVLVHSGAGTPYRIDGKDVRFIRPADIMGTTGEYDTVTDTAQMEMTAP